MGQQSDNELMSNIAISAQDLLKKIQEDQCSDVNELVSQMLHDRQAA